MNLRFLQILVILISLAFLGLIIIQLYWVKNSIVLKEQEFAVNVNGALNNVVLELEKIDAKRSLESLESFASLEIISDELDGEIDTMAVSKSHEDRLNYELEGTIDSFDMVDLDAMESSHTEILEQAGILSDIIHGIYNLDVIQNITDKTNYDQLDSILKSELLKSDIKAKYMFGVYNSIGEPEIMAEGDFEVMNSFQDELFFTQLYPHESKLEQSYSLRVAFPNVKRYLVRKMWVMLSISGFLILLMITAFTYAFKTIFRQKQLSVIKNDFINNMTHELKTPISTISLACEALGDPDMLKGENMVKSYVGMIRDENKRLGLLVEKVLRSSVLDQGEMELKIVTVNVHDIIKKVINGIAIQVRNKGGVIKQELNAVNPVIEGDRVHLTNLIYNLIDNAVKYSKSNPEVTIRTSDNENYVKIVFADNGIGISKENQGKIFDRLYRVPTGNVHNVKGFGLGLSYVKVIAEKHGGSVEVKSEIGMGSEFMLNLPRDNKKD